MQHSKTFDATQQNTTVDTAQHVMQHSKTTRATQQNTPCNTAENLMQHSKTLDATQQNQPNPGQGLAQPASAVKGERAVPAWPPQLRPGLPGLPEPREAQEGSQESIWTIQMTLLGCWAALGWSELGRAGLWESSPGMRTTPG